MQTAVTQGGVLSGNLEFSVTLTYEHDKADVGIATFVNQHSKGGG